MWFYVRAELLIKLTFFLLPTIPSKSHSLRSQTVKWVFVFCFFQYLPCNTCVASFLCTPRSNPFVITLAVMLTPLYLQTVNQRSHHMGPKSLTVLWQFYSKPQFKKKSIKSREMFVGGRRTREKWKVKALILAKFKSLSVRANYAVS